MKLRRISICIMFLVVLCGCGLLRENSYVVVKPHNEEYEVSVDSDVITVSSYLSLKNAILNMVEDGNEEGVIRAEAYSGNISEDLRQAVYEVSKLSPLGAYAVSTMTYDYSRIVSYYEIHINTTFRRTQEEIRSIEYVTDIEALRTKLQEAMETYETKIILHVGDYDSFDLQSEIETIYLEHPEFALELPEASMDLYPENGTQRIIEIKFSYIHSTQELMECRDELREQLDQISLIYGSSNTDYNNARRFYNRLGRDAILEQTQDDSRSLVNSVYGVLIEECATSYGFAQAYRLLLESCEIPCQLIAGQKNGAVQYWCLAEIDGSYFYVDPSMAAGGENRDDFLMGNAELEENGYVWDAENYPLVELPEYLKSSSDDES